MRMGACRRGRELSAATPYWATGVGDMKPPRITHVEPAGSPHMEPPTEEGIVSLAMHSQIGHPSPGAHSHLEVIAMAGRRCEGTDMRELLRRIRAGDADRRIARELALRRTPGARYRRWAREQDLGAEALPDPAPLAAVLRPPERVSLAQGKAFLRTGDPVRLVETQQQQLVGAFAQAGRTGRPRGKPRRLFTYDVPHRGAGKAIPSGPDALPQARALVTVGATPDTAEFTGGSIRRWWRLLGQRSYPPARLLLCADAGGRNENRLRAWKGHRQESADAIGRPITGAHYPPGTSQGNQVEPRLFACIRMGKRHFQSGQVAPGKAGPVPGGEGQSSEERPAPCLDGAHGRPGRA